MTAPASSRIHASSATPSAGITSQKFVKQASGEIGQSKTKSKVNSNVIKKRPSGSNLVSKQIVNQVKDVASSRQSHAQSGLDSANPLTDNRPPLNRESFVSSGSTVKDTSTELKDSTQAFAAIKMSERNSPRQTKVITPVTKTLPKDYNSSAQIKKTKTHTQIPVQNEVENKKVMSPTRIKNNSAIQSNRQDSINSYLVKSGGTSNKHNQKRKEASLTRNTAYQDNSAFNTFQLREQPQALRQPIRSARHQKTVISPTAASSASIVTINTTKYMKKLSMGVLQSSVVAGQPNRESIGTTRVGGRNNLGSTLLAESASPGMKGSFGGGAPYQKRSTRQASCRKDFNKTVSITENNKDNQSATGSIREPKTATVNSRKQSH